MDRPQAAIEIEQKLDALMALPRFTKATVEKALGVALVREGASSRPANRATFAAAMPSGPFAKVTFEEYRVDDKPAEGVNLVVRDGQALGKGAFSPAYIGDWYTGPLHDPETWEEWSHLRRGEHSLNLTFLVKTHHLVKVSLGRLEAGPGTRARAEMTEVVRVVTALADNPTMSQPQVEAVLDPAALHRTRRYPNHRPVLTEYADGPFSRIDYLATDPKRQGLPPAVLLQVRDWTTLERAWFSPRFLGEARARATGADEDSNAVITEARTAGARVEFRFQRELTGLNLRKITIEARRTR